MPIVRRTECVPLPMVVRPVIAVAMLESRVARCVHCEENVACYACYVVALRRKARSEHGMGAAWAWHGKCE